MPIAVPANPYEAPPGTAIEYSSTRLSGWFVLATVLGLHAYVALQRGPIELVYEMVHRDPVDWLMPTAVFALTATPVSWISNRCLGSPLQRRSRILIALASGFAFGILPLYLDHAIRSVATALSLSVPSSAALSIFAASFLVAGSISVGIHAVLVQVIQRRA